MRDGILSRDHRSVFQSRGDMVREIRHDGREDGGPRLVYAADDGEEVDRGFEAAGEETGAGQEKVADGSGLEVESRGWGTGSLQNFEVQVGENGSD